MTITRKSPIVHYAALAVMLSVFASLSGLYALNLSVSGTVKEKSNAATMAGVTVALEGYNLSATTNSAGYYSLSGKVLSINSPATDSLQRNSTVVFQGDGSGELVWRYYISGANGTPMYPAQKVIFGNGSTASLAIPSDKNAASCTIFLSNATTRVYKTYSLTDHATAVVGHQSLNTNSVISLTTGPTGITAHLPRSASVRFEIFQSSGAMVAFCQRLNAAKGLLNYRPRVADGCYLARVRIDEERPVVFRYVSMGSARTSLSLKSGRDGSGPRGASPVQTTAGVRATSDISPGLDYILYNGNWPRIPDFNKWKPIKKGTCTDFTTTVTNQSEYYGIRFSGLLDIPSDGAYTFSIEANNGAILYIGSKKAADYHGSGATVNVSESIELKKGKHPIMVDYFKIKGTQSLKISYSGPGIAKTKIPNSALYRYILPQPDDLPNPPASLTLKASKAGYLSGTQPVPGVNPAVVDFSLYKGPRVLALFKSPLWPEYGRPSGRVLCKELAAANGFTVDTTDEVSMFTDEGLDKYQVVMFWATSGADILNSAQKDALQRYVRKGRGFIGMHCAIAWGEKGEPDGGTLKNWPWYQELTGSTFAGVPYGIEHLVGNVRIEDTTHITTSFLQRSVWTLAHEWYIYDPNPRKLSGMKILANLDQSTFSSVITDDWPLVWYRLYDGGRSYFHTFGDNPVMNKYNLEFKEYIYRTILWAAGYDSMP